MLQARKLGIIDAFRVVKDLGIKTILSTIQFALFRDRQDRNYLPKADQEHTSPTDIVSTTRLPNGERFRFVCGSSRIELEVIFLSSDLVQVSWGNASKPVSYAIVKTDWPMVNLVHEVSEGEYRLRSSSLQIIIHPDGGIYFSDASGNILREEMPPEFSGNKSIHRALLEPESAIYGLGERAAPLNLRGGSYVMWNSEMGGSYGPGEDPLYTCIPVYMSITPQHSYLIFYENSSRARFTFSETAEVTFEAGMLRYYFIFGSPPQLIERYTELTGKPSFPPRWALGYHQSRWGYKTEADIRRVSQEFLSRDIPVSAIHLDIDYMQGYRVFTINSTRFPNLKGLANELESKNIKLVSILDPGIKEDQKYFMYREGTEGKYFCLDQQGEPSVGVVWSGRSLFPEFTNPAVRQWWSEKYPILLDAGFSGFWHDMNEPSSFSAWGDHSLPISTRHDFDGQGGDHLQGHNLYGLLMARAGYESLRHYRSDNRPWILSRAGWAGYQRFAWNWTGDIETSWEILRVSIATVLGLSLSGQPYSGPDIGGFNGDPTPELYTRWIQLSSFLPFFRTHSSMTCSPREPWSFGEPYTQIVRQYIKLRYQLLPYWYTLAWQSAQMGTPLVRPVFWLDFTNPKLYDIDDLFLLGNAVLVVPVLKAGIEKLTINLPPGQWYDFWENSSYSSSEKIDVSTPLAKMPIFIKAGKILPLQDRDDLSLHIYFPDEASFEDEDALTIYSDSGDGWPNTPNAFRVDTFQLYITEKSINIKRKVVGEFPWPYRITHLHFHGRKITQGSVDGIQTQIKENGVDLGFFTQIDLML